MYSYSRSILLTKPMLKRGKLRLPNKVNNFISSRSKLIAIKKKRDLEISKDKTLLLIIFEA